MKVIFNYDGKYKIEKPVALALGTFDGIHIGHQELIKRLQLQKKKGHKTVVYTFLNHPMTILAPDNTPAQLMLLKEKIKVFSQYGIDYLILNPFNCELKNQSREQFLSDLLSNFNIKSIMIGFNFKFGYKGLGDTDYLRIASERLGFNLVSIDPVKTDGDVISSSLARSLIANGKVKEASTILGRPYMLAGKVVRGFGLGKVLGFPTANMKYSNKKQIPKIGVYAVECRIGIENRKYIGVTSIGYNPTFERKTISIETYIIDFRKNIYGKTINISFIEKLRDEIRFNSLEELSEQIKMDVRTATNLIYKIR